METKSFYIYDLLAQVGTSYYKEKLFFLGFDKQGNVHYSLEILDIHGKHHQTIIAPINTAIRFNGYMYRPVKVDKQASQMVFEISEVSHE